MAIMSDRCTQYGAALAFGVMALDLAHPAAHLPERDVPQAVVERQFAAINSSEAFPWGSRSVAKRGSSAAESVAAQQLVLRRFTAVNGPAPR